MPFKIVRSDITKMKTDAIVNTANPQPIYAGGTDRAVYEAAGAADLLAERKKIGSMKPGQAAVTPAFALPAKYIIHTVGPVWKGGDQGEEETLENCYRNCLEIAGKQRCKSISFPLIATGIYGFPKDKALKIALACFSEFLTKKDMQIYLVVFDRTALQLSQKLMEDIDSFIDDNYVEERRAAEYAYPEERGAAEYAFPEEREAAEYAYPEERGAAEYAFPEERRAAEYAFPDDDVSGMGMSEDDLQIKAAQVEEHDLRLRRNREYTSSKRSQRQLRKEDKLKGAVEAEQECFSMMQPVPPHKSAVGSPPRIGARPKRSLEDILETADETFQQQLFRLIKERGFTNVEVYTRANLDKRLFAKIKSNVNYMPKKQTAMALCLALQLNMDEAKDLLARAGYTFSPSNKVDLVIRYFIEKEVFDVYTVDVALFEHDLPMLSNYS